MSSKSVEDVVVRPFRFVSKLASDDPENIRETMLHFHHPLHPPSSGTTPAYYQITHFKPLPGGRYILTGSACGVAALWDCKVKGEQPTIIAWTQMPNAIVRVQFASEHLACSGHLVVASLTLPGDAFRYVIQHISRGDH